ncbi:excinuclease ABC subunit B [bacterium DOLZORAL124_38_8]|nr:MAG: excinuclease ABC subunit B [bacterium DOLZORAL124_38_8]
MQNKSFELVSDFAPMGDQPQAIEKLLTGLKNGLRHQTLLGATGTGKTFTMAQVIQATQRPTLILAHNKTLAAQLCNEFQQFFPNNAVSYFVSYYDYYQPEAYVAKTDTFIEKEATINEEINKYRHAATVNLLTRRDTIIVSSVSCIYGIGNKKDYSELAFRIENGRDYARKDFLKKLVDLQYERVKSEFKRGTFEVLGDTVTIFPPNSDSAYQLEFWGDSLDKISEVDGFTNELIAHHDEIVIFPAKHNITQRDKIESICKEIEQELSERLEIMRKDGNVVGAHRLEQRTKYDIEMLREVGYVSGIENYTRYINGSPIGEPPTTLLDYFPDDFLCFIDESHITIPQIGGMFNGNLSRKESLITHGFRLPSAMDNRPLKFEEFEQKIKQAVYVSATPGKYEYEHCDRSDFAEQIIRPTGLVDPRIEVRDSAHAIDDVLQEVKATIKNGARCLITTVTKKNAEDLSDYLIEQGIKTKYLHSDIETLERIEILTELRKGTIDVVVGINLLREGLDLPEVELISILDADKQGFLRSRDALLQIIGRAARNANGRVHMYSHERKITAAMKEAIDETNRRRDKQIAYNTAHGITPQTIFKKITDIADSLGKKETKNFDKYTRKEQVGAKLVELEMQMDLATQNLDFEQAAILRDEIELLEEKLRKMK